MLGILYKILAKAVALRINPYLRKYIHASQSGFIGGRSILDNILTVQLGIEYAQCSKQDLIMLQLDFAKAFDTVRWDFIKAIMLKMGFGPKISHIIFLLAQNAQSVINLNGRLTDPISISRSVRQGCPLSPLLFAIATHPLFCYLESQATNGELVGLKVANKNILGLGFADDTYLFSQANNVHLAKCMEILGMFSLATGLNLNIEKSTLINLTASNFESLIWHGKKLSTGYVFRHLGYPVAVNVNNKMLIDWVLEKLNKKINYWKPDQRALTCKIENCSINSHSLLLVLSPFAGLEKVSH